MLYVTKPSFNKNKIIIQKKKQCTVNFFFLPEGMFQKYWEVKAYELRGVDGQACPNLVVLVCLSGVMANAYLYMSL